MQLFSTDPRHPGFFAVGQEAVGFIALGQASLGVIAIGQIARGVFCLGQGAIGVFSIGQGSIGLVHATGMLALAGNSGYGVALHLLPRLVKEPLPELPEAVSVADIATRAVPNGWVDARISRGPDGHPVARVEGASRIDLANVTSELVAAIARGEEHARLRIRAELVVDDTSYRSTETHTDLVAEAAIPYTTHRPRYLAYPVPPKGAGGAKAKTSALVWRSLLWLAVAALVSVVSFAPLASALLSAD